MKNKENVVSIIIIVTLSAILAVGTGYYLYKNRNSTENTIITAQDLNLDIKTDYKDIDWSKYKTFDVELTETHNITEGGVYNLTGTISNGLITIETSENVKLVLNNVSITNTNGPCIYVKEADNVVIYLAEGSTNKLEDSASYADEYTATDVDVDGAIYSKADLIFDGTGTLNVTSNYKDAIVGKDDLVISNGNYVISSKDDAIRGKDSVYIIDGKFEISAKGDGIKSTNDTDENKGFVCIEGGKFSITSENDAIQATKDILISNGDFTISAVDDAIHSDAKLVINNGTINITKSKEGLEGSNVTINGGDIKVVSTDDGINASDGSGSTEMQGPGGRQMAGNASQSSNNTASTNDSTDELSIVINGGNIYVNAAGDGIDSNGSVYVTGGNVLVDGPTNNGNGALDYNNEFKITGGTVIAGGSSGMAQGASNSSTIYSVLINFESSNAAGTVVSITDESGNQVASYTGTKAFTSLVVATDKLKANTTYKIMVNGSEYKTFTTSNIVTTVGTSSGMQGSKQNDRGFNMQKDSNNTSTEQMPTMPDGESFQGMPGGRPDSQDGSNQKQSSGNKQMGRPNGQKTDRQNLDSKVMTRDVTDNI